jgi:hypothetical protein
LVYIVVLVLVVYFCPGERCAQGYSGETRGKEAIGETQTQMGGKYRWIFRKWEGVETGWSWLRIGTGGGHL